MMKKHGCDGREVFFSFVVVVRVGVVGGFVGMDWVGNVGDEWNEGV